MQDEYEQDDFHQRDAETLRKMLPRRRQGREESIQLSKKRICMSPFTRRARRSEYEEYEEYEERLKENATYRKLLTCTARNVFIDLKYGPNLDNLQSWR